MYGSNALGRDKMSSDDDQQERSPEAKTPDKSVNIPKPVVKPRTR
jgi:uncharacterized protein